MRGASVGNGAVPTAALVTSGSLATSPCYQAQATSRTTLSMTAAHATQSAIAAATRVGSSRPAPASAGEARAHGQRARRWIRASSGTLTTPAHPTSARPCPALAGNAQLDGQRGGDSSDARDAFRHLPRRERSTRR
ncbi:hypothetical protein EV121DRAFT_297809 [Schizophyllum commune]